MALAISGKTALVTGGGSGICVEVTKRLLAGGCNVLVSDLELRREAEEVIETVGANEAKAIFLKTDVTKWDQLQNAFETALHSFGRLDIVIPGAGIFEPPFSNFWNLNKGVDTMESSSFKTLDVNITHPIRATQLAIDYFLRQKLGHGVVVIFSSIAAQAAFLPAPMYIASKHAMSGFTRSLGGLEPLINIRVNAVAPGNVKTPLWTEDKLAWVDEEADTWTTMEKVADTVIDLITDPQNVGGTVLEVGVDQVRPVSELHDPGPQGRGHSLLKPSQAVPDVFEMIKSNFGK